MGIPLYFRHIIQDYKNQLLLNVDPTTQCERIFFDFNCIVHASAAKVMQQAHKQPPLQDTQDMFQNVIHTSVSYLLEIIKLVHPSTEVFIAIDGPCPYSKIVQQRKRRFLSVWKKTAEGLNPSPSRVEWDSNCVTPGTFFMDQLNDSVKAFVAQCNAENKNRGGPRMMVSDSTEFGEGEHKIFKYMRAHPGKENTTDLIYGLDADLILLSLCALNHRHTPSYNIGLLREVPEFNLQKAHGFHAHTPFLILDMQKLGETIVRDHGQQLVPQVMCTESFIKDYILICTFFGNDFLPTLSFLKVGTDNVSRLMHAYKVCIEENGQGDRLVTDEFDINIPFLKNYLSILAKEEDEQWKKMFIHYADKKVFVPRYLENQGYKKKKQFEMDRYPLFYKEHNDTFVLDPFQKGWRMNYYHHYFGHSTFTNTNGQNVQHACHEYMKGLQFVCDYYWKQNPDLHWHFPYFYAPTLLDLTNFLAFYEKTYTQGVENRKNLEYIDRLSKNKYLQLLCVLPPQSMYLIPEEKWQRFMIDIQYGCAHYYPRRFKLTTLLKDFLWECHPIIPTIHLDYLYHQIQSCASLSDK